MQPDVPAQLAGLRRILEQIVAPAVGDAFAATQLRAVGEVLDQLAAHWPRALPLLAREQAALCELFAEVARELCLADAPSLVDELRARIAAVEQAPAPEAADLAERTRVLRALLSELIRALAASPASAARDALRARVRSVLRTGLDRALEV